MSTNNKYKDLKKQNERLNKENESLMADLSECSKIAYSIQYENTELKMKIEDLEEDKKHLEKKVDIYDEDEKDLLEDLAKTKVQLFCLCSFICFIFLGCIVHFKFPNLHFLVFSFLATFLVELSYLKKDLLGWSRYYLGVSDINLNMERAVFRNVLNFIFVSILFGINNCFANNLSFNFICLTLGICLLFTNFNPHKYLVRLSRLMKYAQEGRVKKT